MRQRVVVIGLDGVCPDLIGPWMDAGELPTFQRFSKEGCFGTLQSTVPTMTPPGWVSIACGKNPGQHGVYGFADPGNADDGGIISSADVRDKRIWNVLDDYGLSSCIVNLPVTYPPEEINGIMVSGFLTPSGSDYTYPPSIQEELKEKGYVVDITTDEGGFLRAVFQVFDGAGSSPSGSGGRDDAFLDPSSPDSVYAKEMQILEKQVTAFLALSEKRDWDFMMYVTRGTDVIQHFYWDKKSVILKFMKAVDRHISLLAEELPSDRPTDLMVVSDHGFESAPRYRFYGGSWACHHAYGRISLGRIAAVLHPKISQAALRWRHVAPVLAMLLRSRRLLDRFLRIRVVPWIGLIVRRGADMDRIINELSSLSTPDGGKVFSFVKRREEVYSGRNLYKAPNLIWLPTPECFPTDDINDDLVMARQYPTPGAHWGSRNGLIMALGPGVKKGGRIEASVEDVAPTIYALLSVPIPGDLDGRILEELLSPQFLADLEVARGPPSVKEEVPSLTIDRDESEIRARLRALGYVE